MRVIVRDFNGSDIHLVLGGNHENVFSEIRYAGVCLLRARYTRMDDVPESHRKDYTKDITVGVLRYSNLVCFESRNLWGNPPRPLASERVEVGKVRSQTQNFPLQGRGLPLPYPAM